MKLIKKIKERWRTWCKAYSEANKEKLVIGDPAHGLITYTKADFIKGWIPENLDGLDLMAGCVAVVSDTIVNNGWLILGIVLASFAAALTGNRFKFQQITLRNGLTALLGGVLLGWSSMITLGCTVGVLLSGTQSFALSGWVFFATVFIGSWLGIKLKLHKL
jgi:hypothetical protein